MVEEGIFQTEWQQFLEKDNDFHYFFSRKEITDIFTPNSDWQLHSWNQIPLTGNPSEPNCLSLKESKHNRERDYISGELVKNV